MRARPAPSRRPSRPEDGAVSAMGALTAVLLIGGTVALAVLLHLPARVVALGEGSIGGLFAPTTSATYGEAVELAGRSDSPPVEVVASAPRRVVSRTPGQHAVPGNVLVGAPVTIRNVGEVTWSAASGLEVHAVDSRGATYAVRSQVTATAGAHALSRTTSVRPGRSVRGVLVFEVPRTADITKVTLTLGSGLTRTAAWSADGGR